MHPRRSAADQDAISRRLALLGDELAGVRPARAESAADLDVAPDGDHWWDEHTHVAPSRRPPPPRPRPLPPTPAARATPARLPVPGRHADRRRVPGIALAAPQLAVVAVVVTVALAVTCWWLVRGRADPADPVTAAVRAAPAAGLVTPASGGVAPVDDASPAPTAGTRPATVTVDVAGKVRHPGIAVLDAGARVVDALQAAGGTRPGVDLTGVNLARVLVDGEQVVVGVDPPTGVAAAAASGTPAAAASPGGPATLVDLNTAGQDDLDSLPEVGPVTAASILAWRAEHGGFTSVDELLEVDGIGEVTLAKIAPFVTV